MNSDVLLDYRWLVGDDGAVWLQRAQELSGSLVAQASQLRGHLTPHRVHLLLEQRRLRQRAARKFEAADRMFFTPQALEQATDQWIAKVKALRFPQGRPVVDLCCGIGGDLTGLASRSLATAVDKDPVLTLLAEANCLSLGIPLTTALTADATKVPIEQFDAWHIDPDRRPHGHRTARLAFSEPSIESIERMLKAAPNAALKLAPGAHIAGSWAEDAERQWIGSGRECRQQVAWFGSLADHPHCHTAVVMDYRGGNSEVLVGQADTPVNVVSNVGDHVFEPHATVLAAGLTGALARKHNLGAVAHDVAYLTGDRPIRDALLDAFHVLDIVPFDTRRLRQTLRKRGIGRLEVKKRGVAVNPEVVRRKLLGKGSENATLLVTRLRGSVHAILARRCQDGGS